jgi:hypothetical protein
MVQTPGTTWLIEHLMTSPACTAIVDASSGTGMISYQAL